MTGKSLQERFFNKIKGLVPPTTSFVDELAELLDLSTDSVYRRMRNETPLTIDEIAVLCKRYRVSLDVESDSTSDNVTFYYSKLKNTADFKAYLSRILFDMNEIKKASHKQITYAAIDIPIFHHFQFPQLASFKVFYWLRGVMNDPVLHGKKFDNELIDKELLEIGNEVYKSYCQIPTVEIWTNETINSQLEQIQYYWESGLFKSQEDALEICELTREEISLLQQQADCGSKMLDAEKRTDDNNYMLYQSEIEIGNNAIVVDKGEAKGIYISCHTLNYMLTTQPRYCQETQEWFDNLIRKSQLISGVSEKQRYKFFKIALDKIDKLIEMIKVE